MIYNETNTSIEAFVVLKRSTLSFVQVVALINWYGLVANSQKPTAKSQQPTAKQ